MSSTARELKQRVGQRDRLLSQVAHGGADLHERATAAARDGDWSALQAAVKQHDEHVRALLENLRIYQAELHAQADELATSQSHTEAQLARFAALFGNLPVAALLISHQGEVREANDRACKLLHLGTTTTRARLLHRHVHPEDYQHRVRPAFHEALATGRSSLDKVRMRREDGSGFPAELHLAALPMATQILEGGGTPTDVVCVLIDRSEAQALQQAAQRATEALRLSERQLAEAARLARTGSWTQARTRPGASAPPLQLSTGLPTLLGWPAAETADVQTLLDCCSGPSSRGRLALALHNAAEHGQAFNLELEMRRSDGQLLRVQAAGHADEQRVVGVLQDVSNLFRAERRIDELSHRLSLANEAGGVGVWDWDITRGQLYFDDRMCSLLGMDAPPSHPLDRALRGRLQPEDEQRFQLALNHAMATQGSLSLEFQLTPWGLNPAGMLQSEPPPERWLHLAGRALFDETDRTLRMVGCAWDTSTERAAARLLAAKESAELASRSKSAFLSRMSHELRTPLNAIMGFAQLMRLEAERGDLVVKPHRVAMMETSARHLLELIDEVLDVTQVETGHMTLRLQPFDLREALHDSLAMVWGAAEAAGIGLDLDVSGNAPVWVQGDRLRCKEVLINLLSNAIKYNRPAGHVQVSWQHRGEDVALAVRDTGRGLTPEQLAALFQPFNRLGAETSEVKGSGMGLFVSKRFVDLMGGQLLAESQPDVGSCFTVVLRADLAPADTSGR
ncbi:MAG: ATP-binding protein [Rubrivivax sp.]|jgi:two-component system cell cycle sensor histidine kinase PleC